MTLGAKRTENQSQTIRAKHTRTNRQTQTLSVMIDGPVPDARVKQGFVSAMLGDDWQQIILQDMSRPQLLPDVPCVILVSQVPDEVLHALCNRPGQQVSEAW